MNRSMSKMRGFLALGLAGLTGLSLVACEPLQQVSFEVNSTTDAEDAEPGDGVCETATPGECTLRAAVQEANTLPSDHQAVIGLQPAASYAIELVGCFPWNDYGFSCGYSDDVAAVGDFDIIGNVSIVGRGATIDGKGQARLFDVRPGARLKADNLTLRRGGASFEDPIDGPIVPIDSAGTPDGYRAAGGAIFNQGTLVLEHSNIIGSYSVDGGGALHQLSGSSTLRDVHISQSVAAMWQMQYYDALDGSVIEIDGGDLVVQRSSFTANGPAHISRNAAAVIDQRSGTGVSIIDSTIANNTGWDPGCLDGQMDPPHGDGCGHAIPPVDAVHNDGGTTIIVRSTFLGNRTDLVGTGTFQVGGSVFEHCEVVATSLGFNVDSDGSCHGSAQPTDVVAPSLPGEFGPSLAGLFGPLGAHGGATDTLLPLAGVTEVVDAIPVGTPLLCDGLLPLDQRRQPRPVGLGCDVGAVERQPGDT